MLRALQASVFVFFLASITVYGANKEVGIWEVLENCRLIKNSSLNDGDSFLVKTGNDEHVFRLYFVDALEVYETYMDRVRDQARYFSILEDEVVPSGEAASKYTKRFLSGGSFTVITKWEDARGSGKQPRYYALVVKDGEYLSTKLVENGLARIYGMPTRDKWPRGVTTRTYLSRLKNAERAAQRAKKGIWAIASGSVQAEELAKLGSDVEIQDEESSQTMPATNWGNSQLAPSLPSAGGLINVNTATAEELDSLPGIGPALAARIIAARPFETIESLADISGISLSTVDSFRSKIIVKDPPPPAMTVSFYLAAQADYLNSEITLLVDSVFPLEIDAPDGFRAVRMDTASGGKAGGSITAFIPDEFYDSFLQFYSQPGKEFKALFYLYEETPVLVYQRK